MGPSLYSALKLARIHYEASSAAAGGSSSGGGGGGSSSSRGGPGCYFSLEQISCIAANCFEALAHMHSIQLTHTDLKPENILFVQPLDKSGALPPSPQVGLTASSQPHHAAASRPSRHAC